MKVVLVNGYPESGKTTFEEYCKTIKGAYCEHRSTVDKVKEIAKHCGWDGTKTPENRKFLSDLKDLLTQYNNLPIEDIKKHMKLHEEELKYFGLSTKEAFILCDVREPAELQKMKDEFGAITVFIRRAAIKNTQSNHADAEVENFEYDYVIDNNGSLDDLYEETEKFLNWLFK